jgi:hypothetical protein
MTMAWCGVIVASIILFNFHPEYKKVQMLLYRVDVSHGHHFLNPDFKHLFTQPLILIDSIQCIHAAAPTRALLHRKKHA